MIVCYLQHTGSEAYPYTRHLVEFEQRGSSEAVPSWLHRVSTPLMLREWSIELSEHPDPVFRNYILNGIQKGFCIGFNRVGRCTSAASNMHSALENAAVVLEYLQKEVLLGRMIGPVSLETVPEGTQISPFGVIPKSNQPGKWRLIVDLSSPDGIETNLCSLSYLRLDDVIDRIVESDRGTKMDIVSAYRMVPVHPGDRPLLAVQWAGQIYFDTRLPFGLRSAPKIFSAIADALQWVFQQKGVTWVAHYLDDYITTGPPHGDAWAESGNNAVVL